MSETTRVTVDDVMRRVEEIRANRDDDEKAHSLRDDLYRDVLETIRAGHRNASVLADLALATETIEFGRWCG